ncbi:MAG: hypothetical protein WDZ28_01380 [Simkaniaceae bacterium]
MSKVFCSPSQLLENVSNYEDLAFDEGILNSFKENNLLSFHRNLTILFYLKENLVQIYPEMLKSLSHSLSTSQDIEEGVKKEGLLSMNVGKGIGIDDPDYQIQLKYFIEEMAVGESVECDFFKEFSIGDNGYYDCLKQKESEYGAKYNLIIESDCFLDVRDWSLKSGQSFHKNLNNHININLKMSEKILPPNDILDSLEWYQKMSLKLSEVPFSGVIFFLTQNVEGQLWRITKELSKYATESIEIAKGAL